MIARENHLSYLIFSADEYGYAGGPFYLVPLKHDECMLGNFEVGSLSFRPLSSSYEYNPAFLRRDCVARFDLGLLRLVQI